MCPEVVCTNSLWHFCWLVYSLKDNVGTLTFARWHLAHKMTSSINKLTDWSPNKAARMFLQIFCTSHSMNKLNLHKPAMSWWFVQGLFVPFACVGSGDPARVLLLLHNKYTGYNWSIYCWDICTTCRYRIYVLLYQLLCSARECTGKCTHTVLCGALCSCLCRH